MSKRKWRWVTRDETADHVEVKQGVELPYKSKFGGTYNGDWEFRVVAEEFVELFGIRLKRGEAVKLEFSAKVIE